MSYQVIARKFRPQKFQELIGQDHISQTLLNALKNKRVPQALLFAGPRGTGKTSTARILAKALRCPQAVDFVPCGVCTSCEEIATSRSPDVIEIDGASHNGVDSIRDLREGVAFRPSSGHFKVYIIDEVHMLSTSAFNALLKTLEEPPEHVVFMLATTEVGKLPATILSRCQRFDFRRISTRSVVERMQFICDQEKVTYDEEVLWTIARQGEGSMRDSLSLLDQVINFSDGKLTQSKVLTTLGLADRNLTRNLLQVLLARNPGSVLDIVEKFSMSGGEPELLLRELLELIRATLLLKISDGEELPFLELASSEIHYLRDFSNMVPEEDLHMLFDMCMKAEQDLRHTSDPRLVLDMVLLRMAAAPRMVDLKAYLSGTTVVAATPAPIKTAPTKTPNLAPQKQTPAVAAPAMSDSEKWYELVQGVRQDEPLLAAKLENLLFIGKVSEGQRHRVRLQIPAKLAFLQEQLSDAKTLVGLDKRVEAMFGTGYASEISLARSEATAGTPNTGAATSASDLAKEKEEKKQDELFKKLNEHPKVKSAASAFNSTIRIRQKGDL